MEENDEHILLQLLSSLRILDGIRDISLADEKVTTGCTPEHTLEGGNLGTSNHTSNVSELILVVSKDVGLNCVINI